MNDNAYTTFVQMLNNLPNFNLFKMFSFIFVFNCVVVWAHDLRRQPVASSGLRYLLWDSSWGCLLANAIPEYFDWLTIISADEWCEWQRYPFESLRFPTLLRVEPPASHQKELLCILSHQLYHPKMPVYSFHQCSIVQWTLFLRNLSIGKNSQ